MKRWIPVLFGAAFTLALLYQLAAVVAAGNTAVPSAVTIIDLGTLGGTTSRAADLNEARDVVGSSTLTPTAKFQGFLWRDGDMRQLSVTAELPTFAHALNEAGQVVGAAVTGPDEAVDQRPVLWQNETFLPLELDNTLMGSAQAINDAGLIAGHTLGAAANDLLIWQEDTGTWVLTATVPFSGGTGVVTAVNNQSQIVGTRSSGAADQAFLYAAEAFQDLPGLDTGSSAAFDINDAGHIAGSSTLDGAERATLWVNGQPQDLDVLDNVPGAASRALGLNNNGLVAGTAQKDGAWHAVLWVEETVLDLNDFLPEDGPWDVLQTAVRVNDGGWIAGTGLQSGEERAFLLFVPTAAYTAYLPVVAKPENTPTPQPSPTPPPTPTPSPTPAGVYYDMMRYMGDGRLYELRFEGPNGSSQSRHQTQTANGRFYHTKGNEIKAEWEELWNSGNFIYRGTDTSPGFNEYYSLYTFANGGPGTFGSSWSPRYWRVGDQYFRQPFVIFYSKANCQITRSGYPDASWLRFERFIPSFEAPFLDEPIRNVVQLAWYLGGPAGPTGGPIERYYYGEGYGLVAWQSLSQGYSSSVSEIFQPGERPDNKREVIPCLQNSFLPTLSLDNPDLNFGPLPEPYASRIRR